MLTIIAVASIGLCAILAPGFVYFAFKASSAGERIADARIARYQAEEAQRQSAADLAEATGVVAALNQQVADRDAEIAGFARRSLATLGDNPDADDVLRVLAWLQEQAGDDDPEADTGPVPDWLHRDPAVADEE